MFTSLFSYIITLIILLQKLRGNIRVHCRVRPVLDFDRGASECIRCSDDVRHSRGTIRPGSYGVVILQETIRVSYSQPSVSGVVLQEKAFEFDRLRLAT